MQTVPFVNGVKTGYTLDAGNVLVGSGEQKGVELVSAVLGAPSESERDSATPGLLDYGFSLYHQRTPVQADEQLASVAIHDRDVDGRARRRQGPVRLTVRTGQELDTQDRRANRGRRARDRAATGSARSSSSSMASPRARAPLVATYSAAAASLVERFDAARPRPASVAWVLALAASPRSRIGAVAAGSRADDRRAALLRRAARDPGSWTTPS